MATSLILDNELSGFRVSGNFPGNFFLREAISVSNLSRLASISPENLLSILPSHTASVAPVSIIAIFWMALIAFSISCGSTSDMVYLV